MQPPPSSTPLLPVSQRRELAARGAELRVIEETVNSPPPPDSFSSKSFVPLWEDQEPVTKILNNVVSVQLSGRKCRELTRDSNHLVVPCRKFQRRGDRVLIYYP